MSRHCVGCGIELEPDNREFTDDGEPYCALCYAEEGLGVPFIGGPMDGCRDSVDASTEDRHLLAGVYLLLDRGLGGKVYQWRPERPE